jgi:hypothetical protein
MKRIMILFALFAMVATCMPTAMWADPPDVAKAETVTSSEAMPVQAVQPIDLQIIQHGDSVTVIVNGQHATFFLKEDSKAGKALGVAGIVLALIVSILAWYRSLTKQKFRSG